MRSATVRSRSSLPCIRCIKRTYNLPCQPVPPATAQTLAAPDVKAYLQDPPGLADNWLGKQQQPTKQDSESSKGDTDEDEEAEIDESDDSEGEAALHADQDMQDYHEKDGDEAHRPAPRRKGKGTAVRCNIANDNDMRKLANGPLS